MDNFPPAVASNKIRRKLRIGGLLSTASAPLWVIIVYVLGQEGINLPAEVAAAGSAILATLVGVVSAYFAAPDADETTILDNGVPRAARLLPS